MKQHIFKSKIKKEISNFLTGEKYLMIGGTDMIFSDNDIRKITEICSQEKIYKTLFERKFNGKPYTEENARSFVKWLQEGWKNQTHFVFLIRKNDSEIIGAIDIKSPNFNKAEIGYWADENYRGFTTDAVNELSLLVKEAGYLKLFGRVLIKNLESIKVLERAGFKKIKEYTEDGRAYFEYEKQLLN